MKPKAVALALLLAVSSCSSGDDTVPSGESTAVDSQTTELVETATTTSVTPTTVVAESQATDPATTVTAPAPSEPTASVEESVAERIRGYFDAREAANAAPSPNPDDPRLAEFATGTELASVIEETTAKRDAGRAIRPGEGGLAEVRVGSVVFEEATGTAAVCSIDDGVVFEVASGDVIDNSVLTHSYTAELAFADGEWKVSQIVRLQQWEGVAGCALAAADYPY